MGKIGDKPWIWNVLVVIALITVFAAYAAHYKNWTRMGKDSYRITSGIYYLKVPFADMDSVGMVERLPSLKRINGFSVNEIEKGAYREDSTAQNRVYVFVEKLSQPKIRVVYRDSLQVFLNFRDSAETRKVYRELGKIIDSPKE
jgi:hypothetical protein